MRIGIDATAITGKSKSGVEWYTRHLLVHLAQILSHEKVFLYTPQPLPFAFTRTLPILWKVRVLQWPLPFGWVQLRLSFELLLHPIDIYFSPSYMPPLYHPKKTVVTIHDVAVKTNADVFSSFERMRQRVALWRMMESASRICTVSSATQNDLRERFPEMDTPVTLTPLGIDEVYFRSCSAEHKQRVREVYRLPEKYFLVLGRVVAKKNPEGAKDFVRAYRERTGEDQHIVFVGKVEESYKQQLAQDARAFAHFLGYVPEEDIPALLQEAAALLFLSHKEGFGLPVLQAFASGIPVVIGNEPALKELAGGYAFICLHTAYAKAAQELHQLLGDRVRLERIRQQMRGRAKHYTWRRTAEKTLAALLA